MTSPDTRSSSPPRATTDAGIRSLDTVLGGKSVFAGIHCFDPHDTYHPDPETADAFDAGYQGRFQRSFGYRPRPGEPQRRNRLLQRENEHIRPSCAGDICNLEPQVDRLIAAFRSRLGGNLVMVFTADHGESFGEHDAHSPQGSSVYSDGTRIPLAVVLPPSHPLAFPTGVDSRCRRVWVSPVDVVPILLELIDLEAPRRLKSQPEPTKADLRALRELGYAQ